MSEDMSERSRNIILKLNRENMELKKKLEAISKIRVECAKLQLEMLKLYNPKILEITKSLKQVNDNENLNNNTLP